MPESRDPHSMVVNALSRLEEKLDFTNLKVSELKDSLIEQLNDLSTRVAQEEVWHIEIDKQRDFWTRKAWPDHVSDMASLTERIAKLESLLVTKEDVKDQETRIKALEEWKSKAIGIITFIGVLIGALQVLIPFIKD